MGSQTTSNIAANICAKVLLLIAIANLLVGCGTYGGIPQRPSPGILNYGAEVKKDSIQLDWQTNAERGCGGFNIYRSIGNSTTRQKINSEIIRPKGVDGGGASYVYKDPHIKPGRTYNYTLENINMSETTSHGPMSVTVKEVK